MKKVWILQFIATVRGHSLVLNFYYDTKDDAEKAYRKKVGEQNRTTALIFEGFLLGDKDS